MIQKFTNYFSQIKIFAIHLETHGVIGNGNPPLRQKPLAGAAQIQVHAARIHLRQHPVDFRRVHGTAVAGQMTQLQLIALHTQQQRQGQILLRHPAVRQPFDRRRPTAGRLAHVETEYPAPARLLQQFADPADAEPLVHDDHATVETLQETVTQYCGLGPK